MAACILYSIFIMLMASAAYPSAIEPAIVDYSRWYLHHPEDTRPRPVRVSDDPFEKGR